MEVGVAEFGVEALGFVELVFEGDDAAGGVDGAPWSTSSRTRAAWRSWFRDLMFAFHSK